MVNITNGVNVVTVSEGAFNTIYKGLGFSKVEDAKKIDTEREEYVKEIPNSADDNFAEKVLEKPISEWTAKEVKRFADIKGVDIAGTKNPTEAKELIKTWLEENE